MREDRGADAWAQELGRALTAAGREPSPGAAGLLDGARRRARVHRRRRRTALGGVAAVVLAVPVALSQLDEPVRRTAPAVSPAPTATSTGPGDAALLRDADVADVLPGVSPLGPPAGAPVAAEPVGGLCTSEALDLGNVVAAGRAGSWGSDPAGAEPREDVTSQVLQLSGDGAQRYLKAVRNRSDACLAGPPGSAPWQFDDADRYTGPGGADEAVAGLAPETEARDAWRMASVQRSGDVVVVLHATAAGDQSRAYDVLRSLSRTALERAVADRGAR